MNSLLTDARSKRALSIAVVIALSAASILLWKYMLVIATAAIASFTFYPVYTWIKKGVKKDGLAAWLTAFLTLFAVIIPVALIVAVTANEISGAAKSVSQYVSDNDLGNAENLVKKINEVAGNVSGGRLEVTSDQIKDGIQKLATTIGNEAPGVLAKAAGSAAGAVTGLIIYLYLFAAITTRRKALVDMFKGLNPLGDTISDLYIAKASAMTKATVRGQFIIALIQGFLSAFLLYIVGIDYFWIAALVLTFLSIIPLGSGIVVIPIGIVMLLTGSLWQGIVVLLTHIFIINNVDNVLRPVLVPKEARLNPALMLLAVFGGINFFGILGIVIGPVVMILIVTTIRIYILENRGVLTEETTEQPKPTSPKKQSRKKPTFSLTRNKHTK